MPQNYIEWQPPFNTQLSLHNIESAALCLVENT